MSIIKKITSIAVSAAMISSLSFSINTSTNTKAFAAIDSSNDDWLYVDGNKIVDMYGNEVWITGCNWFGFNVGSGVFDGVWSCNMHDAIKSIADRGLNFCVCLFQRKYLLSGKMMTQTLRHLRLTNSQT